MLKLHLCWKGKQWSIESWSGSAGYTSEMLTEGAQSWRVEYKSRQVPSVNITTKYPVLPDHDEIEVILFSHFLT